MVPDEAVDAMAPVGDASAIADRLGQLKAHGVDLPVLFANTIRFGDSAAAEGTIRGVAAELRSRL
jgi:hypothetical protein